MKENKSPQLENGYIRIATEIWRELGRFRVSGEERMVLDCILAKTYGFNKKMDRISISQFFEFTEMKKPSIIRAIKKLLAKKLIIVPKKGIYQFNKDYNSWVKLAKVLTNEKVSKSANGVSNTANKKLAKVLHTIDSINTIQKTYASKSFFTSLTEKEIDSIITSQRVSLSVVQDYMTQADEWSNGGGNKKLSWYITIRGWIRRDIKAGKLKQNLTQEEELELEAKKIGLSNI